jgi:hypothetical protein
MYCLEYTSTHSTTCKLSNTENNDLKCKKAIDIFLLKLFQERCGGVLQDARPYDTAVIRETGCSLEAAVRP